MAKNPKPKKAIPAHVDRVELEIQIACTVRAVGRITVMMPEWMLTASESTRHAYIKRVARKRMQQTEMTPYWTGNEQFDLNSAVVKRVGEPDEYLTGNIVL